MSHVNGPPPPSAPARRNRGWIGFFVVLAALVGVAIGLNWWYNLHQQLKRADFDAARADWQRHAPPDYDLEYEKLGSVTGSFFVQVRQGKVVSAWLDGRPLEPRLYATCDMTALFDDIERFLDLDAQPGQRRTFIKATFDIHDGHLLHYIRSVTATQQRIEIRIHTLTRVPPGTPLSSPTTPAATHGG